MNNTKKKLGPTTRQLLKLVSDSNVTLAPVFGAVVGQKPVTHNPRTKFDPQPWTDGFFRYHAWELHAVDGNE